MTSFTTHGGILLMTIISISLLLLISRADGQASLFNSKLKDGVKGTPGVKARLTKKGFNYMGRIIGNLFAEQVPMAVVPDIAQELPSNRGTVRLTDVHITKFQSPKNYEMSAAPPNQIKLTLFDMAVTAVGQVTGAVNIIVPMDLQGELEVEAGHVDVIVSTALEKTSAGLPFVRLLKCSARVKKIRVSNHNGGLAGAGVNIFQAMVTRQARPVLQNLICLRARELVDRDLNSRLSDTPPVVSLARARQIDLFGLEANQPMTPVPADQTRRQTLVNGIMVRRQKRQDSRQIPQSSFSHVIVHKPYIHQSVLRGTEFRSVRPGVPQQYAYPQVNRRLPQPKSNKQSTVMDSPAAASQFSPSLRMPTVRPLKSMRVRRPVASNVQPNVFNSELPPVPQASLFAPSAVPAAGIPEEKMHRPVSRPRNFMSDSASPQSPSLPSSGARQARLRTQQTPRAPERHTVISDVSLDESPTKVSKKGKTGIKGIDRLLEIFDLNEAVENLYLDYSLVETPKATSEFVEVASAGEVSYKGLGGTPFFPALKSFPAARGEPKMLEVVISDFLPNSLLYHANRLNMFSFDIDNESEEIGQYLRTTCEDSLCLGSLLPSLEKFPHRDIEMMFKTTIAPSVIFSSSANGVMKIELRGVLDVYTHAKGHVHHRFGAVEVHLTADATVKLNGRTISGEVKFDQLNIKTRDEKALPQEELDTVSFVAQEILEGLVNQMLKEGIPVPLHPIFELVDPRVDILDREMLLTTDVRVNEEVLKQVTTKNMQLSQQRNPPSRRRRTRQRN